MLDAVAYLHEYRHQQMEYMWESEWTKKTL